MKSRLLWGVVLGTAVSSLGIVTGCQPSGKGAVGKRPLVAVDLAPNSGDYTINKVGILTYRNGTDNEKAREMTRFVIAALVRSGKYQFTKSGSLERDARRSDAAGEFDRLVDVWEHRRTLNKADVASLCKKTGYDALIVYEITEWAQEKLDVTQEGTSNTTVGLRMELWADDGTRIWNASGMKVERSPSYNPEINVRSTQNGQAVRNEGLVPDPPLIEPVAQEVADDVVKTLPQLNDKPAAAPAAAPAASDGR